MIIRLLFITLFIIVPGLCLAEDLPGNQKNSTAAAEAKDMSPLDEATDEKSLARLVADGNSFSGNFPTVGELPVQNGMPDPFLKADGSRIMSTEEWPAQRTYLKAMLAYYMYGTMPPRPKHFDLKRIWNKPVFTGKAVHERYAITLNRIKKSATFHIEIIRSVGNKRLPGIIKNCHVFFEGKSGLKKKVSDTDLEAAKEAVSRGYLLCKFNRHEVAAYQGNELLENTGVLRLYPEYDWGTIAAWAWTHSLVADALEKLEVLDVKKMVATGHSRGGKTALCAGIYDERIAITAPNSSGAGGTASLRYFEKGQARQRLDAHQEKFPFWWQNRYFGFFDNEDRLPFDAHTRKALIAPRALFNAHARQDYWANPYGTELTYRAADKVFKWLGADNQQGLHWREGKHAQNQEDWLALLDFADWKFFGKKSERSFSTLAYPDAKLPVNWKVPVMSESRNNDGQQDASVNEVER